ncbi:MAG: K(+)-transporting ATPase subunit F [Nostocaceae cyanobacterium]|nr:K(+)-transporting ATPase subunit F [Nostocaceae cyanobacterium]
MKLKLIDEIPVQVVESAVFLRDELRKRPLPLRLFLALCFNLILAPTVLAATDGAISRVNAYALGILALVTVALAIYLFAVMLQPERF